MDDSTDAYEVVLYIRHNKRSGEIVIQSLAVKVRVAPSKTSRVPRLELTAALLGLRLAGEVTKTLNSPIIDLSGRAV